MINVDYARARRQEIIERQTELSEKPRMSEADHRAFRKLQDEFERLTLDINKARQEERDAGVWTGGPIHDDAPYTRTASREHLHPVARSWVQKVSERLREVNGELRALTVTGDLALDFPIGIGMKPERSRYVADAVEGPVATWLRETAFSNQAAAVARGATKPESALTLVRESADLQVLAHLISGVANEDLEDEESLQQIIAGKLFEGLRLELDDQIVNGDGTSPNQQGSLDRNILQFAGDPSAPTHRVMEQRLDYILIDPGWQVRSARVLDDGPSDHRAVLAELVHP